MFPTVPSVTPDPPQRLPRGPHQLDREVVRASQRGRLLDAMAEVVAERGYAATTVADVIGAAGVSRKTFYEHFRDKEDCFLAAYDAGVDLLLGAVRDAGETGGDLIERARARTRRYLETLAAEPAFARTFLIEVAAAGPAALAYRRVAGASPPASSDSCTNSTVSSSDGSSAVRPRATRRETTTSVAPTAAR